MSDAVLDRIEKQLEGNNLALSAVAEVLQKMDSRLSYDEAAVIEKQEEVQAATERTTLIKDIAIEVAGMLKADQGMDVSGKERKAKSQGKAADDTERPVNPTTKIGDQQNTIQAMVKGDDDEDKAEEYPVEEKGGKRMAYSQKAEDDEDPEEDVDKGGYGEDEDEDDKDDVTKGHNGHEEEDLDKDDAEDEDDEETKSMRKQLKMMKKQLKSYENSMEKTIKTESENRLRKMGFREENGLTRPRQVGIGTDGTTPIKKSGGATPDTIDQLTQLSYKELREMQHAIEQGQTDGIPRELIQN